MSHRYVPSYFRLLNRLMNGLMNGMDGLMGIGGWVRGTDRAVLH